MTEWNEVLSGLIQADKDRGVLKGVKICRGAPPVSHLLFADDTMIFCQATLESFQCIGSILHRYAEAWKIDMMYILVYLQSLAEIKGMCSTILIAWQALCDKKEDGGKGFRDVRAFNQAFLSKQAWRLIKFPNSLLSRILKARYFPNCSFFEARKGTRPSLSWASILWAREVVTVGSRWRIGSGQSVSIWTDRWLPRPTTFRVITAPNMLPHNASVASLINHITRAWDSQLVRQIFWPPDVDAILAYHVARGLASDDVSSSSNLSSSWKFICGTKVPHKVRVFAWRVCRGILPTLSNLLRHRCQVVDICPCCESWLRFVAHQLNSLDFQLFLVLAYSIWSARNKVVWDKVVIEPLSVVTQRMGNRVAHTLARSAVSSHEGSIDPPASVFRFLVSDIVVVA
ncbi:hypothetical protein BUALT_Bualt07G0073400 [Buddleja alternifolia]|uniref:Reverse transcriptase zinc-binding domain-containing protein n=1 Tax=Buddleja alternifolia TaxID=168488 RepID=A0AAV6X9U6_9LAMI|nr:hypothetical protein BUALT_Bualt07G0073400 [Buddleja alternifolia]